MQTAPVGARFDLTDAQCAVLEPLLPTRARPGHLPTRPRRRLIDGMRWWVRVGAPWRDVPEHYGLWQSICTFFRCRQLTGVWAMLVTVLPTQADACGLIA